VINIAADSGRKGMGAREVEFDESESFLSDSSGSKKANDHRGRYSLKEKLLFNVEANLVKKEKKMTSANKKNDDDQIKFEKYTFINPNIDTFCK